MNKITIFVIAFLMMMSLIVESVAASEASEVLKARLNLRKNTLKAVESKVEAKVDVGVDSGVGNGANTNAKTEGGLESQLKLSKSLKRNVETKPSDATDAATIHADIPVRTNIPVHTAIPVVATIPFHAEVPISNDGSIISTTGIEVNFTAVVESYLKEVEEKINKQIAAIQKAYVSYKKMEKEKLITGAAKILSTMQIMDMYVKKIEEAENNFSKLQNEKTEANKKIIATLYDAMVAKEKLEKKEEKAKVENMIKKLEDEYNQTEVDNYLAEEHEKHENLEFGKKIAKLEKMEKSEIKELVDEKIEEQREKKHQQRIAELPSLSQRIAQKLSTFLLRKESATNENANTIKKVVDKGSVFLQKKQNRIRANVDEKAEEKVESPQPAAVLLNLNNKLKQKFKLH